MRRMVALLILIGSFSFLSYLAGSPPAFAGTDDATHCGSSSPCARCCMGMEFDRVNSQLVLFGGTDANHSGRTLGDTWVYDLGGTNVGHWTWVDPSTQTNYPCTRHSTRMAYDQTNDETVMFGGDGGSDCTNANQAQDDTWTWDGSQWSPKCVSCVTDSTKPEARASFGFAWDAADNYVLLFGGTECSGGSPCQDTWAWGGTTWSQKCSGCSPSGGSPTEPQARSSPSMIYSSALGYVLLSGGAGSGSTLYDGSWDWNGSAGTNGQWSGETGVSSPSVRSLQRMAYDENTSQVMMYGGCKQDCNDVPHAMLTHEQYTRGSSSWSLVSPSHYPSARCCVGLIYASTSPFSGNPAGIFLFGGADNADKGLGDFYFYTSSAWCKVVGTTTCNTSF